VGGVTFVADGQSAVVEQPGDGPLDHPAVLPEFLAGLDALARYAYRDTSFTDPDAQRMMVVCLRRDLIAGTAMTKGWRPSESLVLAAETATDNGNPTRLDNTWIFEPGSLPRSTGLGPVIAHPFSLAPTPVHDLPRPVDQPTTA
jgi:hypothetical protein